jgi:hypothetical protein
MNDWGKSDQDAHLVDTDWCDLQDLGDLVHGGQRHPVVVLALGQIEQRQGASLVRVFFV